MIKLFTLKKQGEEGAAGASVGKQTSAAYLRAVKDHNELSLPTSCALEFDDPDDLLNFRMIMRPSEGLYVGGRIVFTFQFNQNYPHDPPKVHCDTKIYHPNIDLQGNVCLNILREDWKPVLNLQAVVHGLVFLFLEPNPLDPLNKDAAVQMQRDRALFEKNVRKAMAGGSVDGEPFDKCLFK
jgi:ubiquitin-conjugating enzyme E2 M